MRKKINCILLIDDDEATNFLSNIILEEASVANHIKTKQTAKAALNYIADSAHLNGKNNTLPFPDLIFLDMNMPAMDGWEFVDLYRELAAKIQRNIIIIMLTTSLNPDDKIRALQIPEILSFENKPLTTEIVHSIMERFFPVMTGDE